MAVDGAADGGTAASRSDVATAADHPVPSTARAARPGASVEPLRVSVIVPLFNKRELIRTTLDSAIAQSRPADEILVIDDGSTDGSGDLVRHLPGIRYERQANAGPAAARNRGIALAGGDVIAFLDADDRWTPDKLERQLAFMESHPDVAWCASNHRSVRPGVAPRVAHPDAGEDWTVHADWFVAHAERDRMLTSGVLVRRAALLSSGGFDESIAFGQDGELWTRIALEHPAYGFCGTPLFDYLDVDGSVSKPGRRRFECRRAVVRLHLERSRRLSHAGYRRYARRKCQSVIRSALSHGEADIARTLAVDLARSGLSRASLFYLALATLPASLQVRLARGWRKAARPLAATHRPER